MVQQLSLFGSIDDDSYDLFISTMTTFSGNPPILFTKLSTVWVPNPSYNIEGVNSKNQLVEKTRIKISTHLPLSTFKDVILEGDVNYLLLKKLLDDQIPIDPKDIENIISNVSNVPKDETQEDKMEIDLEESPNNTFYKKRAWCISISDIPAAGNNKKVSMQTINESIMISTSGPNSTLQRFMTELGYVFEYQYVTVGVKFNLKHNLTLELQKIWNLENNTQKQITKGGFLIKAFVNVGKSTDIDRIDFTENVLINLQKELQGYVDLTVPDRKTMDSRIGLS